MGVVCSTAGMFMACCLQSKDLGLISGMLCTLEWMEMMQLHTVLCNRLESPLWPVLAGGNGVGSGLMRDLQVCLCAEAAESPSHWSDVT